MKKWYFYSVFLMLTCMLAFCERAHEPPSVMLNKPKHSITMTVSKLSHQLGNASHIF